MYSKKITPKVEKMFNDLRVDARETVFESHSLHGAVEIFSQRVNSETTIRSKAMLSDMLLDLRDGLFNTSFFANNISRQNEFFSLDLQQEVLDRYQFLATVNIDYQESSRVKQAVKVGSGTLAVGGMCGLGVARIAGLSFSSLVPVPIGILFVAAVGAVVVDCMVIEPNRNKNKLPLVIDEYLIEVQKQYLNWFDEIESYYNKRVDELKDAIG